ncbi:MAG: hypothetical protein WC333_00495 [Dehalococcoidia bacterium]|jgi:outer membrane biosynthesis protein TonB
MSTTSRNVKSRTGQPDAKNFVEKKVEIPEVLMAQQPELKPPKKEPRKLERPEIRTVPPEKVLEKSVSIDSNDDDKDYGSFVKNIEDYTKKVKDKTAAEIMEKGERFLREIEAKKNTETMVKYKHILYILKHSKGKHTAEELQSYSLDDVKVIFLDIKRERKSKSFFTKIARFFRFIFNM